jgi:hypothetical protein
MRKKKKLPAPSGNTIFISYSQKDRRLFEEFTTMLAPVVMGGQLDIWHDQRLAAGGNWYRIAMDG